GDRRIRRDQRRPSCSADPRARRSGARYRARRFPRTANRRRRRRTEARMSAVVTAPLKPGSIIGILGGGQLGRMLAMSAAELGFKCHVDSDVPGPALEVAHVSTVGAFDDLGKIAEFACGVDVVTYEFENVPLPAAAAAQEIAPVRPGP